MMQDAWRGVVGTWRLYVGDDDVSAYYDFSAAGFFRSFGAALLALPIFMFLLFAQRHVAPPGTGLWEGAAVYVVIWAVFPLVAYLLVRLQGNRLAFVPWVVTHNWATVVSLGLQTLPYVFYVAGVMSIGMTSMLLTMALVFVLFIHYRVCRFATQAPVMIALVMTSIHVLANYGGQMWVDRVMQVEAVQDEVRREAPESETGGQR